MTRPVAKKSPIIRAVATPSRPLAVPATHSRPPLTVCVVQKLRQMLWPSVP